MADPITGWLLGLGVGPTAAGVLGNLGASLLFSTLSGLLAEKPTATDAERDILRPKSTPSKRFLYGVDQLAMGTPAPAWVTKDGVLYACYILNSRPSDAVSQLVFDRRYMDMTGDPYDFAGAGADVDHPQLGGFVKCWIGLGDQAGPPDVIMTDVGDASGTDATQFWPTDRWSDSTVIWGRFEKGPGETRSERWPSAPPQVGAVGDWSKVWDPRDPDQDANDPATWTVSNNAWLCILDVLRFNPLSRWSLDQLNIASFIAAANDADALRTRLDASTEPRWRLGGTVYFGQSTALLDVILPMVAVTGGDIMIDGEGLTAIPATAKTPLFTVTDWLSDGPMQFRARQRSRDVPKAVQATWRQPEAKWEEQTMTPAVVPGQNWSGGDDRLEGIDLTLAPFGGQVQHAQQIAARRKALGRELSFLAGPEFFAHGAQSGDWVTVDFGVDFATRNGTYEIREIQPGEWIGGDGVAFRQPVTLREIDSDVMDWNADSDEMEIFVPPDSTVYEIDLTLPPPIISLSVSDGTVSISITALGVHIGNRAEFSVEYKPTAGTEWIFAGKTPAPSLLDGDSTSTSVGGLSALTSYDFRVRAELPGRASVWVTDTISTPDFTNIIDAGGY